MERNRLTVKGMHCSRCEETIRKTLGALEGVSSIRVDAGRERISYRRHSTGASTEDVIRAIETAGYQVDEQGRSDAFPVWQIILILIIVGAIAAVADRTGILSQIPAIGAGMSLGLILMAGLLTSVHCVGMCGGICLSQSLSGVVGSGKFKAPAMYNLGRLASYITVGFLAGGLGSVISPGLRLQGMVILIAGIFMILLALKMVGLLNIRLQLPGLNGFHLAGKGPLVVGFLNGFLPCGPLQAVQLYALGTGSPWKGAAAMALFCLGTMPLMFTFGSVGSLLSNRFRKRVMQVGAMVILVMAIGMTMRGWMLAGFSGSVDIPDVAVLDGIPTAVVGEDGIQRVKTNVTASSYQPFVVQTGIPLEWTLVVEPGGLNGCNNPVTVPALGISLRLAEGENTISFIPESEGRVDYTCWMGMIDSEFFVVEDLNDFNDKILASVGEDTEVTASCCSVTNGGVLPGPSIEDLTPEDVAIASRQIAESGTLEQYVTINVSEKDFAPKVLVLQKDVPAVITFRSGLLNEANYRVSFPEYGKSIELAESTDSIVSIVPDIDFRYVSWQGDWIGIFRIVDDLEGISSEGILDLMSDSPS